MRWTLMCLPLVVAGGLFSLFGQLPSPDPPATAPPTTPPPAKATKAYVEYAEANLALARVEQRIAEETNRRIPKTYPNLDVERRKMNVAIAEDRVRLARSASATEATVMLQSRYAQENIRLTERAYQAALVIQKKNPAAYNPLEIERLRLQAEVARLRLAVWQDPDVVLSILDQMQWQVDGLSEEVLELHKKVNDLQLNKQD